MALYQRRCYLKRHPRLYPENSHARRTLRGRYQDAVVSVRHDVAALDVAAPTGGSADEPMLEVFIPISFFNILGVGIWGLIFPKDSMLSIIISVAVIILGLIFTFGVLGKSLSKRSEPPPSSAERRISATT